MKCLPCSSSSHLSFGALSPLLLFSAFVLSHFLANSYTFNIYFSIFLKHFLFFLANVFLLRLPPRIPPRISVFTRFFCARFGSEPDKRNVSARHGPGGFFNIYFSIIRRANGSEACWILVKPFIL